MLIGIISDTHNQADRSASAMRIFRDRGVEAVLHCGDVTRPSMAEILTDKGFPTYFVYGNNDEPERLGLAIKNAGGFDLGYSGLITIGPARIGMTHGDRPQFMQKLAAQEPDYLLFGHSHVATEFRQGTTRFINPGALHRAPKWTFATLDLSNGTLEWHELSDD
jgi:putative phosphoesterase